MVSPTAKLPTTRMWAPRFIIWATHRFFVTVIGAEVELP
jgi:hypothetical protein